MFLVVQSCDLTLGTGKMSVEIFILSGLSQN